MVQGGILGLPVGFELWFELRLDLNLFAGHPDRLHPCDERQMRMESAGIQVEAELEPGARTRARTLPPSPASLLQP
jgi:hypothetical protein